MEWTQTGRQMMTDYHTTAAAHKYALGFHYGHDVYYTMLSFAQLSKYLQQSEASRGQGTSIKVRPSREDRVELVYKLNAVKIGTVEELKALNCKNAGEAFERLMVEKVVGEAWKKDSTGYWVKGDFELNGEQIQAKYEEATLCNESTIMKAKNALGL